jgi:hypothetical protein
MELSAILCRIRWDRNRNQGRTPAQGCPSLTTEDTEVTENGPVFFSVLSVNSVVIFLIWISVGQANFETEIRGGRLHKAVQASTQRTQRGEAATKQVFTP